MPLTTDLAIRKWKPAKDGQAQSVGGRDGLYVRGWLSGKKAFYFRNRSWIKVGDYPLTSLAQARELATVAKRLSRDGYGNDTLGKGFDRATTSSELESIVKHGASANISGQNSATYDDLFGDWFKAVAPTLQEGPSRRRPRAIHDQHISPVIGKRPVAEIRRREVFELLAPLFRDIPVSAGHALGHLNKVFERAINLELAEANPVPPRSAFPRSTKPKRHHGTLPPERLPELWQWVKSRAAHDTTKLAILTALCTGHRIGVVVNARWAHITLQDRVWRVPPRQDKVTKGAMKSGREYALELPGPLLEMLWQTRDRDDQEFVFESPINRGAISPNAILKILKGFEPHLTAHGFRNSIKIWCRNADPVVPDHIADAFCDHSLKGLDASYRRADTSQDRAALSRRLFDFVTQGG